MRYTGEYLKEQIFPLSGWREFIRTARNCRIILKGGSVTLSSVSLYGACVQKLVVDGKEKTSVRRVTGYPLHLSLAKKN